MQEEIVAYMLAYDQQNCYRGAKVRLVVKMRNGTQLFLNDVEYDSMTIAAEAFPDVLRRLNGDLDEMHETAPLGYNGFRGDA